MKRRNTRKAISLGQQASFRWQVREDLQRDDEETLAELPMPHGLPVRWIVLVSMLLIGAIGYWSSDYGLRHDEADGEQVEVEVAETILLESSFVTPNIPGLESDIKAEWGEDITLLELYGDKALVNMVIHEPSEPWYEEPFRVARVLQQDGKGWQLIEPESVFWSGHRTLETEYLELSYSRRDERAVGEIAADLESFYLRLHEDLSLPTPTPGQSIQINIALVAGSPTRVTDLSYSGSTLIIPPPDLIPRPLDMSNAEALHQAIAYALAVKLFDGRQEQFPTPCKWRAVTEGIGIWLRWEGHTLPSRRRWEYENAIKEWSKPTTLPQLDDLRSVPINCLQPPPLLEVEILNSGRPMPRNELAATLIEYMATEYGRQIIPILLRDLSQFSSWNTLAQASVDLTAKELEAGWQAYLIARTP